MSTHTSSEPNAMPFRKGQTVRHKSGMLGVVTRCERRVCQGATRVCITVEYHPGSKLCDWYADNCELVEDVKAEPTGVESELCNNFEAARTADLTDAVDTLLGAMQPGDTVSITKESRAAQGERPIATPLTRAQAAGVDPDFVGTIKVVGEPESYFRSFDLEPGTLNDQGEFVGISAINGAAVHAEQTTAELKAEIESLAAQRDEARDELKEATAEFVRALAIARRELVLERAGHAGAKAALKKAIEVANGWSKRIEAAQFVLDGKTAEVQS